MVYLVSMSVKNLFLLLTLLFATSGLLTAQTSEEFEANYAKRIKEEILYGVYIPADLEDAHNELTRLADPQGLAAFKASPEDSIKRKLHFGFGRWIMLNWSLEDGSRISHHLKEMGASHPDDMVRVIIVTWHRKLNNRPQNLEVMLEEIKTRVKEEKAKRDAEKKYIIIERRPHKE